MIKTNSTDTGLKASILSYRGDITYFINEIIARYKYAITILAGMSSSAKDIKDYLSRTIEDIFDTIDYIESKMPEGQSEYVDELRATAEEIRRILDTVVIPDIPDIGGDEPECGMAYERDQCQDGYCIGQPSISIGGGTECDACFDFSSGVDMCPTGFTCPGFKAGSGGCTGGFDTSGCHPFTDGFDCYSYDADIKKCYGDYFVGNICVTSYCTGDFQEADHGDCWEFGSVSWCNSGYTEDCASTFLSKDWEDGNGDFYCEKYSVLGSKCDDAYSHQTHAWGDSESCMLYTNDNLSCAAYGTDCLGYDGDGTYMSCDSSYSDGTNTCASNYITEIGSERPMSCIEYNGCKAYASNEGGEICMSGYSSGDTSCEGKYGNDVSTPDCPSDFDSCSGDFTDGDAKCNGYTNNNSHINCSGDYTSDGVECDGPYDSTNVCSSSHGCSGYGCSGYNSCSGCYSRAPDDPPCTKGTCTECVDGGKDAGCPSVSCQGVGGCTGTFSGSCTSNVHCVVEACPEHSCPTYGASSGGDSGGGSDGDEGGE